MIVRFIRVISILFLVAHLKLSAQYPVYKNIGVNEGLLSSCTYYALSDSKGYIWIASDLGISKFNGKNWKHFGSAEGLLDNTIICLAEDHQGKIWMASNTGKLYWIANDKVFEPRVSEVLCKTLKNLSGNINSLQFDSFDTLWVGTSRSLFKIPTRSNSSVLFAEESFSDSSLCIVKTLGNNKSISSQNKNSIDKINFTNKIGKVHVQIENGNKKSPLFEIALSVKNIVNPKTVCLKSKSGEVLFTYLNELYKYSNGSVLHVRSFESAILFMFEDKRNNIYVSLANGNGVIFFENGNFNGKSKNFFTGSSIGSICQDFEGGLWFTSTDKGLFYISNLHCQEYSDYPFLKGTINTVTCFDSTIIVVDSKNDIHLIDKGENIRSITNVFRYNQGSKVNITRIGDKLFYCGPVVLEFDPITLKQKHHTLNNIPLYSYGIVKTKSERMFGILQYDLCEINGNVWKIIYKIPQKSTCVFYNNVLDKVWIGTKKGLYEFDGTSLKKMNLLKDEDITYICQGEAGTIYISTKNNGVFVRRNSQLLNLTEKGGLTSNNCNYLNVDKNGIVWVSTNKGISYFSEKEPSRVFRLNKTNGLTSNEVSATARYNNFLFVASGAGLVKVECPKLGFPNPDPTVQISKEIFNYKEVAANEFVYGEGRIRFLVDYITYKQLFSQQFVFQLKGYEKEVNVTSDGYLDYTNLPEGYYELWLGAINEYGEKVDLRKYYSFTILPPYWKKWWFYLLVSIALATVVFIIIKWQIYRRSSKQEQKREIERLVLESQIVAIRAQMNPHFIFNSINSIQDFVLNNETQQAYDYLAKFAKLIRLVLNNSRENFISLEKEIEWLNIYVELEKIRFKNGFSFELELDKSIVENLDLKIPTMLIQPYIENAIWHGLISMESHLNGKLSLKIRFLSNVLEVVIEDNGVGRVYTKKRKSDDVHLSMGMKLVDEKLNAIKKISGRNLSVNIIDLYHENTPIGTRVELLIEI